MLRSFYLGVGLGLTLVISGCGGGTVGAAGDAGSAGDAPPHSATLTWDEPTTNSDDSPLTDLAGCRVYESTTSGSYTSAPVATVAASSLNGGGTGLTFTVDNLASGTHYFVVRAYDTSGNESANALPGEVRKTIP